MTGKKLATILRRPPTIRNIEMTMKTFAWISEFVQLAMTRMPIVKSKAASMKFQMDQIKPPFFMFKGFFSLLMRNPPCGPSNFNGLR